MSNYIVELAAALEEAADDGISLGVTDTAICAAALRVLAAANEAAQAVQAATVGFLVPRASEAAAA